MGKYVAKNSMLKIKNLASYKNSKLKIYNKKNKSSKKFWRENLVGEVVANEFPIVFCYLFICDVKKKFLSRLRLVK